LKDLANAGFQILIVIDSSGIKLFNADVSTNQCKGTEGQINQHNHPNGVKYFDDSTCKCNSSSICFLFQDFEFQKLLDFVLDIDEFLFQFPTPISSINSFQITGINHI
jgi:hypothetical protein